MTKKLCHRCGMLTTHTKDRAQSITRLVRTYYCSACFHRREEHWSASRKRYVPHNPFK